MMNVKQVLSSLITVVVVLTAYQVPSNAATRLAPIQPLTHAQIERFIPRSTSVMRSYSIDGRGYRYTVLIAAARQQPTSIYYEFLFGDHTRWAKVRQGVIPPMMAYPSRTIEGPSYENDRSLVYLMENGATGASVNIGIDVVGPQGLITSNGFATVVNAKVDVKDGRIEIRGQGVNVDEYWKDGRWITSRPVRLKNGFYYPAPNMNQDTVVVN